MEKTPASISRYCGGFALDAARLARQYRNIYKFVFVSLSLVRLLK